MAVFYEPILFTKKELEDITGGKWLQNEPKDLVIKGLFIASSLYNREHVFIATGGFSAEKNPDYVIKIMNKGVVVSIIDKQIENIPKWASVFLVDDTSLANDKLSSFARQRSKAKIIAITGSVGKTSLKETITTLLSSVDTTYCSYMSVNGGEGLKNQLSLLPQNSKYAIFELGMLGPNSIRHRAHYIKPDVALITSIAAAHMQYHKGIDSIVDTKTDIIEGLQKNGKVLIPRDSEHFEKIFKKCNEYEKNISVFTFGEHKESDCVLLDYKVDNNGSFVKAKIIDEEIDYYVNIPGKFWILNSIAALGCVKLIGADIKETAPILSYITPSFRRGERFRVEFENKIIELIDDTYNANTTSMSAAISQLRDMKIPKNGRTIVILGDMEELGDEEVLYHLDLLQPILDSKIDLVFTVGSKIKNLYNILPQNIRGIHLENSIQMAKEIKKYINTGDVILVKGSNKSKMNKIVLSFIKDYKIAQRAPLGWSIEKELL